MLTAPAGWPLGTSGVRPGREHDTTALRAHPAVLPARAVWTDADHAVLADLGDEGERAALTTPIKQPTGRRLTDDERTVNLLPAATRAPAEPGNALLTTTFTALRRVSLCPWRIGAITAALVLLHSMHDRTTRPTTRPSGYWEWFTGGSGNGWGRSGPSLASARSRCVPDVHWRVLPG